MGSYEICPVCFWEDDPVQNEDHSYSGGANHVSLDEARRNYIEHRAAEVRCLAHVRGPKVEEVPRQ
jgi:Cysteine-rich CPCC